MNKSNNTLEKAQKVKHTTHRQTSQFRDLIGPQPLIIGLGGGVF